MTEDIPTEDIPVIWRHFLRDISHIFYAKRVSFTIDYIDYVTGIKNESREPFSLIHFLRAILVAKNLRYGK